MEKLSLSNNQSWLSWFYRGLLFLGAFILIARLFDLQVIRGAYFRDLAEGNRIRRVSITSPRGEIFARDGEILVGNKEIKKQVKFDPIEGYEKVEFIDENLVDEIFIEPVRHYKLGQDFGHISGYVGAVNEDEVGKIDPECTDLGEWKLDSIVGRAGLEKQYDCVLRGINGEELVEVDSRGQKIRTLGRYEPISGESITTTIDYDLQDKLPDMMAFNEKGDPVNYKGTVIVSDFDGGILGMYSNPSYDPNIFIKKDAKAIDEVFKDTDLPLFNRAFGGVFAPGSVYKPIIALGALEEAAIESDFTYNDTGEIKIDSEYGSFSFKNWYLTQHGGTEGEIDLKRALARSTDTFFYKVGEFMGVETIEKWSRKFGLGEVTGIDLPGEVAGIVPSPEWKERVKGERWYLGNTYHLSIGQGDLSASPLQINAAIGAVATGKLCRPHIAGDTDCIDLELGDDNRSLVREGMVEACTSGGTAYPFFEVNSGEKSFGKFAPGEKVACKTGTAQVGTQDDTHAWFVFFSRDDREESGGIVVTVLVERGGEGSKVAAPIARDVFDHWYGVSEVTPHTNSRRKLIRTSQQTTQ